MRFYYKPEVNKVRDRLLDLDSRCEYDERREYIERREAMVSSVFNKEDELSEWINSYARRTSTLGMIVQLKMFEDIKARFIGLGYGKGDIDCALDELFFTSTLRHYDDPVWNKIQPKMETILAAYGL
ncbi:hypothetical protein ONZ45_g6631 [Pleurotus djamor]|nr:hypothetical protein ONZ45_g6631 [Pleurotus djamor]